MANEIPRAHDRVDLGSLQLRLHAWRQINFPDSDPDQQLMGVVEEVGELAHANLKGKQGIRNSGTMSIEKEKDAVGDIAIFLMGYCSYMGWQFDELVEKVAKEVLVRDWTVHPIDGVNS